MATIETYTDSAGDVHWPDSRMGELKDHKWDFAARMIAEGDTTDSVTWTLPAGLTSPDEDLTDNVAVIWISADAVGDYVIQGKIATTELANNQIYIRNFHLKVT